MTDKYAAPEVTAADAGVAVARAVVQLIPGVGSSALELIGQAIAPPLERRRSEWMREVAEGLKTVEVKLEDLGTHEELLDTFLRASAAALRTSQKEKLEALRNAVVNSATKSEPDHLPVLPRMVFSAPSWRADTSANWPSSTVQPVSARAASFTSASE